MTTLIGTNPDQIPVNSMLGGMAYQDPDSINVKDFNSSGTANIASLVSPTASVTNLSYTGTLTGGTGVINIGSNQIYKDASGNIGLGAVPISNGKTLALVNTTTNPSSFYLQNSTTGFTTTDGTLLQLDGLSTYLWNFENSTLSLATNNTEYVKLTSTGDLLNLGTGATKLQEGTTAQRPASPQEGMIRKNSTTNSLEAYINSQYSPMMVGDNVRQRKNLVINGNFSVNQQMLAIGSQDIEWRLTNNWRALSTTVSTYNPSTFSIQTASPPNILGLSNYLNIATSGISDNSTQLGFRIESYLLKESTTYTLSYYCKSSAASTISLSISYPNTKDTWTAMSQAGQSFLVTNDVTSTSTSWVRKTISFTTPAGTPKGLQVYIWMISSVSSFQFTGFQVEEGSYTTSFENTSIADMLSLCSRYYKLVTSASVIATGTGFRLAIEHPGMRATPSRYITGISYYYSQGGTSTLISPTSTSNVQVDADHSVFDLVGGITNTAGQPAQLYQSYGVVGLSAEL